MKLMLKLERLYRTTLFFFVVLLFWSIWASAQGTESADMTTAAAATTTLSTNKPLLEVELAKGLSIKFKNQAYLSFGLDRVPALQETLWGHPRWQYLASLLYIVMAYYLARFIDFICRVWLKKWTDKTENRYDNLLLELLKGPVKVICFVIFAHIGLNVFAWPDWVRLYFSKALLVVLACSLTYVVLKAVDLVTSLWTTRPVGSGDPAFDNLLFPVIRKTLKVVLVAVAVLLTLQNLGINISSVLAVGSVGALALGLASQDTVANVFGAVSVFIDKPFRFGDRIKLGDVDGTVESMGLRSTRVRNLDGHLITIPNKTMGNATITNITLRPNIKTEMNFGLSYTSSTLQVQEALAILEEVYKNHPNTHDLVISFNKFADSALNILVVHWWNNTDNKAYLLGMQQMNLAIKERFDSRQIEFAFPSRTVYLRPEGEFRMAASEPQPPLRLGSTPPPAH